MEIKLYLRMLQRSWWIVAVTALVAVAVALLVSYSTTPIYQSTARYIVSPNPAYLQGNSNIISSLDTLDRQSVITTYSEVMNSPRMYKEALALLKPQPADLTKYSSSAIVLPNTSIIELTVNGTDPALVTQLNATLGQHVVDYAEGLYKIYDMTILDPASVPTQPVAPQPLQDSAIALVVGLALGVALALLRELFRTPIRNFMRQRRVDGASLALRRETFEEELANVALNSGKDFCLCFVQLAGLSEYLRVLPQSTLENILRHVTQVLKNQLRGNDLVGRWDDTVFAVLLTSTSGQAALNTLGRVQTALAVPIRTDVSEELLDLHPVIGIAQYAKGDTTDLLVENTQQALDMARTNNSIQLFPVGEARRA